MIINPLLYMLTKKTNNGKEQKTCLFENILLHVQLSKSLFSCGKSGCVLEHSVQRYC